MSKSILADPTWQVDHIEPFVFPEAKILILGTFPAPKARETGFYYAHPTNRFWPVLSEVFQETIPDENEGKKNFLKRHKIALWNIVHACYITGAKDYTIKDPVINDIAKAIKDTQIKAIFSSGRKAQQLYRKFSKKKTGIKDIYLPSTSAINKANFSFDDLVQSYSIIKDYL